MHNIINKLNELSEIREHLKSSASARIIAKYLKINSTVLSLDTDNESLVLTQQPGIYYFEAKFNFTTIDELNEFGRLWGTVRGSDVPVGISRYYPNRAKKHRRRIGLNKFIPFYIGIRENISNRIINHLDGEVESGTYSLKLRSRPELFNNIELKYSYLPFEVDPGAYFGIRILEENLRKLLNPIIGKQ